MQETTVLKLTGFYNLTKMKLDNANFQFMVPGNTIYSAHWYPNGSDSFSPQIEQDKQRKFEVAIWRGGGYRVSYYTDHRICEKNSKEFVELYLKSLINQTA